jgi:hypothetical protein
MNKQLLVSYRDLRQVLVGACASAPEESTRTGALSGSLSLTGSHGEGADSDRARMGAARPASYVAGARQGPSPLPTGAQ